MADKNKSNQSKAQTGADIDLQTPAEQKAGVQEKELLQVAATHSSMPVNGANGATGNRPTEAEMKREVEHAKNVLSQQKTKSVSVPKQMAQYTGETMVSCINGACVRIPVDGESYDVPEAYYDIIMNSLKTIHAGDVREAHGFGDKVDHEALKR